MDQRKVRFNQLLAGAVVAAICLIGTNCGKQDASASVHKLRFALPSNDWWTAAPFIIAKTQPIFQNHLLDMEFIQVNSGLASMNAVLAGTADVGVSAATPLALAAARREPIMVLDQYFHSSAVVGLVGPKESIGSGTPAEPVAIVPSTISESFLYSYLEHLGKQGMMERKQLQELIARPADVSGDLKTGSAKSAVIWEPFLSFAAELPGMKATEGGIDFSVSLLLVARSDISADRRSDVSRFLEGMRDACDYITHNPDEARDLVEKEFSFRANFLGPVWPRVTYNVQFDAEAIKAEIQREGRIALALGTISREPDVSYLLQGGPSAQ
jgi:ABC-type nitrate/sulfonate/bicarbonate transport system substrate-binding protein